MSIWKIYGALAALVLMAGIWANGLLRQSLWTPNGLRALAAFSAAYWALALLGPRHVRIVAIALATVWSIASVGPLPVAATVLLLIASYGIGCRLAAGPVAIAAGLAAYAVVTGILAHFPINTAPLYWVLLSIGLLMAAGSFRLPAGAPSSVAESLAIYLASIHLLAALFPRRARTGWGFTSRVRPGLPITVSGSSKLRISVGR